MHEPLSGYVYTAIQVVQNSRSFLYLSLTKYIWEHGIILRSTEKDTKCCSYYARPVCGVVTPPQKYTTTGNEG